MFLDDKIHEIVSRNLRLWDLMKWVNKHKVLAIETLQYNSWPYIEINDL